MRAYEICARCGHQWHGLQCIVRCNPIPGASIAGPCSCPSPFDDDYWNEGDVA